MHLRKGKKHAAKEQFVFTQSKSPALVGLLLGVVSHQHTARAVKPSLQLATVQS